MAAATFAALAFAPALRHAQPATPLLGSWSIEFERGRRVENGEVSPIMGAGTLTITARGDSLLATLETGPRPDGNVPPPSGFGGTLSRVGAVFVQKQTVTIRINGVASTRDITLIWTLQANGDDLTGMLARELPMTPEPTPPTPVKGKRRS